MRFFMINKRKRMLFLSGLVLFIMCLIPSMQAFAVGDNDTSYVITLYNERNGLPTGEANTVLQTSDGYIWIGSYGGLIRYDGTEFRNYSMERKIESGSVRALYEDAKGRLWIGTNDAGVFVMENDIFVKIALPEERSFLCVRDFAEGEDGSIYVASNSGLAKISDGKIIPYEADVLEGNTVYSVAIDTYGRVWGAASNGECIVIEEDKAPIVLASDCFFEQEDVYSIDSDKDGNIVVGSSGSRVAVVSFTGEKLDKSDFSIRYYGTGNVTVHNAVQVSENGEILVSGNNGLAVIGANGSVTEFGEEDHAVSVNAAIIDYENDIWQASSAYGLTKYSVGCFDTPNEKAGLDGVTVNTIAYQAESWYIGNDTGLMICDKIGILLKMN